MSSFRAGAGRCSPIRQKVSFFAKFKNLTTKFFCCCSHFTVLPMFRFTFSMQMSEPCYELIRAQGCQFGLFEARFWNSCFFQRTWLFWESSNMSHILCQNKKAGFLWLFYCRKELESGKTLSELHIHCNLFWPESIQFTKGC